MKKLTIILTLFVGFAQALDCPADSAYHLDTRTLLPDGSPNPNYDQTIATGLCACLGFESILSTLGDSTVMLAVRIVDNEPIRGLQLDVYHDAGSDLIYGDVGEVQKGEKLEIVYDEDGELITSSNA
ncbi:MAG TPA: hypothetical protein DEA65_05740, partial [Candidatus Marinimicrobia bacterium]|nr:hypothetical protein [Candidatus Neomarinimicrobiota bacterium]